MELCCKVTDELCDGTWTRCFDCAVIIICRVLREFSWISDGLEAVRRHLMGMRLKFSPTYFMIHLHIRLCTYFPKPIFPVPDITFFYWSVYLVPILISSKIATDIFILHRLQTFINKYVLIAAYYAFVHTHLPYWP